MEMVQTPNPIIQSKSYFETGKDTNCKAQTLPFPFEAVVAATPAICEVQIRGPCHHVRSAKSESATLRPEQAICSLVVS